MSEYAGEQEYDWDDDEDSWVCYSCEGEGIVMVCCDDICHGQGYCMHGSSGYITCPECKGSGESR